MSTIVVEEPSLRLSPKDQDILVNLVVQNRAQEIGNQLAQFKRDQEDLRRLTFQAKHFRGLSTDDGLKEGPISHHI